MGRFSWGARAKSRKETSLVSEADAPDEGEQGKRSDSAVQLLASSTPFKFLWVLALCAAALFGYCMETTPARISNAMFSNHLFSVSFFPFSHIPIFPSLFRSSIGNLALRGDFRNFSDILVMFLEEQFQILAF